jgi:type II secretory pathway pseudopilin PulG
MELPLGTHFGNDALIPLENWCERMKNLAADSRLGLTSPLGLQSPQGLTLTEVVVALGILMLVLFAAFQVFGGSVRATGHTARRLRGLATAQSVMEALASTPYDVLPPEEFVLQPDQTYPMPIELHHRNLVADSVVVSWSDGARWEGGIQVDAGAGRITLQDPHRSGARTRGVRVSIAYCYRWEPSGDGSEIRSAEEITVSGVPVWTKPPQPPLKRLQVEVRLGKSTAHQTPVTLWMLRAG